MRPFIPECFAMGSNRKRETVFRFKQFQIKNEVSAMKVGTDGVLLGAWADVASATSVLDIGSGSGVISLMAAQRSSASVVAVEIDVLAAGETRENAAVSPWGNRISVVNCDFLEWKKDKTNFHMFDHIVSNPPFFDNGILAPDACRATARHGNGLDYNAIISSAPQLLTGEGRLSLISPANRKDDIVFSAEIAGIQISRITEVCSVEGREPVRILWEFAVKPCPVKKDRISIRSIDGRYTGEYVALTRDFYLNM